MITAQRILPIFLVALPMGLGACAARQLMPTPNIFVGAAAMNPFADVPPELQGTELDILYVTDRMPLDSTATGGRLEYDSERSRSLAFGSCRVRIGDEDVTWDDLVKDSRTQDRRHSLPLAVTGIEEMGRFPETPLDIVETPHGWTIAPEALRRQTEATELLQAEIRRRLDLTSKKEVFIYVHGVANTFESAAFTVAEVWHFFGRQAVPVVFTWPASGSYFYDRESGEFSVFHLKEFLRVVASMPEVEKLHLVAHSRGTDVLTTALRELFIEARGAKEDVRQKYKVDNLLLAAPDLDFSVLLQRLTAENFGTAVVGRVTIYASRSDRAIGLASWLFGSRRRLGQLRPEDVSPELKKRFAIFKGLVAVVDAQVSSGFLGHSYFHDSPAVSSDLILTLRDGRDPGAENGRPLTPVEPSFWALRDGYPASAE